MSWATSGEQPPHCKTWAKLSLDWAIFLLLRHFWRRVSALYLAVGEEFGAASAQASLGHTAYCRGEYEVARLLFEESLQMSRKIGYRRVEGYALVMSGWASLREGN